MKNSLILQIHAYAIKKYTAQPEYLWSKYPEYSILRRKDNNKWFATIMKVHCEKLGINEKGLKEVINVKCHPNDVAILRSANGFLPAYHMNKENWITILLDGSVPIEIIFDLIDDSYNLIGK